LSSHWQLYFPVVSRWFYFTEKTPCRSYSYQNGRLSLSIRHLTFFRQYLLALCSWTASDKPNWNRKQRRQIVLSLVSFYSERRGIFFRKRQTLLCFRLRYTDKRKTNKEERKTDIPAPVAERGRRVRANNKISVGFFGREFWIIYRGPGFLKVEWFGSSSIPYPSLPRQ
jgi:hypothetical protein